MKVISILLLALISVSICKDDEEFPVENDVFVLTDATFDKAIEKYEYLLVLFYAPWCGHCKKFHPEYNKAAATLKKENLYLAKVDATAEKQLAEKFEIQGFPTVKLFIKGEPIEYTGGRKEADVINWMRKKSGPAIKELKTKDEIQKLIDDNEVFIMYFGSKKEDIDEYNKVARQSEEFQFGSCDNEEIAKKFEAKMGTIVLFKKFDEKRNELTTIKEKDIDEFIDKYSSPKVMEFDDKTAQIIFGKNIPGIVLYADQKKTKEWEEYKKILGEVSDEIKGKLKVVLTDIKEGMAARLAEYIGVKESDLPSVRIADTTIDLKKYNMEGEINKKNILQFIKDWEDKKLKPHLKTQEEPKEQKEDIFVIVGKTFEKEVLKNDKDVMLLFYAPWCGHCKKFHPEYEAAAKALKAKNPKLLLAKMDATENEIESVNIQGFPTIKFYPGNKKDKEPLDYDGDRTQKDVIKFIKEHSYNKIIVDDDKEPDKTEDKKEDKKADKNADL